MNERTVLMAQVERTMNDVMALAKKLDAGPQTHRNIVALHATLIRKAEMALEKGSKS